jgi:threonine aldolase
MRQSGVLAAAAIYALDHHRERLAEDHENAQTLAFGLAEIPGIKLNPKDVETNIIFFELENVNASSLTQKLEQHSILVEVVEKNLIRVVTNLMVDEKQIYTLLETIRIEMSQLS